MQVLARFHHLDSQQLGVDIQPTETLRSVEPGTRQGSPPNIHLSLYKLARDPGFSDLLLPHIQYTGSLSVSGFDFDVIEGLTQLFRTF